MVDVAIIGHGVVGSGVAEILLNQGDLLKEKAKDGINLKYILDIKDFPELPYNNLFIKDFNTILNDPDIKVVVETAGGATFAYEYVKAALQSGKNVVTSNKELIAVKGSELIKIALEKNVNLLFEASVGGGTPILRPIAQCLAANDLSEITGILNGTTNFILSKMKDDGMPFDEALKAAQRLGYAEQNPTADVEGFDAARKVCILASLAFGKHIYPEQVKTVGITNITLDDVSLAEKMGYTTKLVGDTCVLDKDHITASVRPAVISSDSIMANVADVFNIIRVRGSAIGDVAFYGRGAGKLPTASAVVADIIDCVKHLAARKYIFWDENDPGYAVDSDTIAFDYMIQCDIKFMQTITTALNPVRLENNGRQVAAVIRNISVEKIEQLAIDSGIFDYRIYRVLD